MIRGLEVGEPTREKFETFIKFITGKSLRKYQSEFGWLMIDSILGNKGKRIFAEWARKAGKTETVADACLFLGASISLFKLKQVYKDGMAIGIFGPRKEQADITFDRVKERFTSGWTDPITKEYHKEGFLKYVMDIDVIEKNASTLTLSNGFTVSCATASLQSGREGQTLNAVILEETQDMEEIRIKKSIFPMCTSTNGTRVILGTPTPERRGYFYKCINRLKHNVFVIDGIEVCKHSKAYEIYFNKMKRELGETSPEFRTQYLLKWDTDYDTFITKEDLEKLRQVKRELSSLERCYAGIDIGRASDSTVVTVIAEGQPYRILNWLELQGEDYYEQTPKIANFLKSYHIIVAYIEQSPLGDVLYSFLVKQEGLKYLKRQPFQEPNKSNMYLSLLQAMRNGDLLYPIDECPERFKFEEQFLELERTYRGSQLKVNHPKSKKSHDDYCLSEDTEILTIRGFLRMNELTETDLVASWNQGRIMYEKPIRITKNRYEGKMILFEGEHFKSLVTPDHKMIYEFPTTNNKKRVYKQKISMAKDLLNKNNENKIFFYISGNNFLSDYKITDDEIRLAGWMITEGWITKSKKWNDKRFMLGQSEKVYKDKVKEIDSIVKNLGLSHNRYKRKDGLIIWQFRKVCNPFFEKLLEDDIHRIPRKFLSLFSEKQLKILFKTIMDGDGTWKRMTYNSSDINLIKDFQELCHRIGRGARIGKPHKKTIRNKKYKDSNNLYILKNGKSSVQKIKEIDYNGYIWCVTVLSGFIITKYQNSIGVVGNSDSLALAWKATKLKYVLRIGVGKSTDIKMEKNISL